MGLLKGVRGLQISKPEPRAEGDDDDTDGYHGQVGVNHVGIRDCCSSSIVTNPYALSEGKPLSERRRVT
jgi:hypothetical protein